MKLLEQFRHALRVKHRSWNTEKSYVDWVKQYIRFHGVRHPNEMGEAEIEQFLTHLAVHRHVAADTQNQAFSAILFLYRHVLKRNLEGVNAMRAKGPKRLPVVLSEQEVSRLLQAMTGIHRLMAELLYGIHLKSLLHS